MSDEPLVARTKIQIDALTPHQKDALLLHFCARADVVTAANNELIKRLSPMPEPIGKIFDQWSRALNAIEDASSRKVAEICGLDADGSPARKQ